MLWIVMSGVGFVLVLVAIGLLSRDSRSHHWTTPVSSSWKSMTAAAVALGLAVLGTLLIRLDDSDEVTSGGGAADQPSSRTSSAPTSTATSTASIAPTKESKGSKTPAASAPRIETMTAVYFGRPSDTVQIPGRYRGVRGPRTLRVQLLRGGDWTQFPLPVTTGRSGRFRAYVYVGKTGTYRLRIVDPDQRRSSRLLTLQLF